MLYLLLTGDRGWGRKRPESCVMKSTELSRWKKGKTENLYTFSFSYTHTHTPPTTTTTKAPITTTRSSSLLPQPRRRVDGPHQLLPPDGPQSHLHDTPSLAHTHTYPTATTTKTTTTISTTITRSSSFLPQPRRRVDGPHQLLPSDGPQSHLHDAAEGRHASGHLPHPHHLGRPGPCPRARPGPAQLPAFRARGRHCQDCRGRQPLGAGGPAGRSQSGHEGVSGQELNRDLGGEGVVDLGGETFTPRAGIMETDDHQMTTVFAVQPSFHHRHSTNRVSWSVTIVGESAVTPHLIVCGWWQRFMILGLSSADGGMTVGL